jgi:hypothetical protein
MTDDLALPFVIERREQLRAICRRAIAGGDVTEAELRSATMKYVCAQGDDPRRVLKRLYLDEGELGLSLRKAVAIVSKRQQERSRATGAFHPPDDDGYLLEIDDDDQRDDDDEEADIAKAARGGAHGLAAALLNHLHDRLESRLEAYGLAKRKEKHMESIAKIIKDAGFIAVAKAMADENRSYGLTETEFVALATENAVRKFPDKTPAAAFTRMFTDGGADGLAIRRAHAVVKASHLEQMFGPTFPAHAKARSEGSAYDELLAKAAEYRKTHSDLSEAQAFAKVFQDPANAALSRRERAESALR